jgi:hypothetical protein
VKKQVSVGSEFFDDLRRNNSYYVDKTELIYELVEKTDNKVTLFTRPRRFGKTLTMTMFDSFFDIRRDSHDVFENLNITNNHPEFCEEWMNQYPTLFLSLKDVEGLNFGSAFEMLVVLISNLCAKYRFLENDSRIAASDAETFHRLMFKDWGGDKEKKYSEIKGSLKTIMRMMHTVYGKPVILIIDEYDVPLAKAYQSKDMEFYHQMLDVIRGLLSTALKTNEYLKFAVLTGCLRVSKESIFTGLNNFACYSVNSVQFSKYFGFGQDEVKNMLDYYDLSDRYELIKSWYDGYIFGNNEVFCPWDVARFTAKLINDKNAEPENFWANTSSNSILDDFVNHEEFEVSDKFETLLNGEMITQDICEELTYDQMAASEKNFWSVLLMTGYVSKADKSDGTKGVRLRIPNAEITDLFRETVVAKFERTLDRSAAENFISAMWNQDMKTAEEILTDILWDSISYFDYGEEYYHGMLNGIFTGRGYAVESNAESGLGRLDLRVKDRKNRRMILMEFKRSTKEEYLERDCDDALEQIKNNGYARKMPMGYRKQIVCGIAFFGKVAKIKLMEETVQ